MACGCASTCGCEVVGDGDTTSVVRDGDTFIVSAIQFISSTENTDCIDLAVDEFGVLRALPIIDPDIQCVEVTCGPDGLRADIIIDPDSNVEISCSDDGLLINTPPAPPEPESGLPGDYLFYSGIGDRPHYLDADGTDVNRLTYPDLWDAQTLVDTTAVRSNGSAIISGISSTRFLRAGMPIEATGFAAATTILTVDGPTQITATSNAGSSGADTELRAYPYGIGDGIQTFTLPDLTRNFPLGYQDAIPETIGDQGGLEDVTLAISEMPAHDHNVIVSANQNAHDHTGTTSSAPNHTHPTATPNRVFVEADDTPNPAQQVRVTRTPGVAAPDRIDIVVDDTDPNAEYGQKSDAGTGLAGSHSHTFTTDSADPDIAVFVAEDVVGGIAGVTQAHENMPPYTIGRWMVRY